MKTYKDLMNDNKCPPGMRYDKKLKQCVPKRIRYKGIDTWESRTRDLAEKKKGLEAKERNRQLLEEVSDKSGYFRLKSYGVGKYGRVLGEIFILDKDGNQHNINETLIKEGHAYEYEGGTKKVFVG